MTLTELQSGEHPEVVERLNKRIWCLLTKLIAEQEGVDIKFRIGDEHFDTANLTLPSLGEAPSKNNKDSDDKTV